jgi:hypothetical protein
MAAARATARLEKASMFQDVSLMVSESIFSCWGKRFLGKLSDEILEDMRVQYRVEGLNELTARTILGTTILVK